MNITINIDNLEDISYINNLKEEDVNDRLKTALNLGLKCLSLTEISMDCNSYFDPIKDIIDNRIGSVEEKIDNIMYSKNNAAKKGKIGERLCMNIISQYYPKSEIVDVAYDGYQGDCRMKMENLEFLLEFKTYDTNVPLAQVDKFKRDMKHTGLKYGIFVSNTSGIVGKDSLEWEINDNTLLVYVSNLGINGFGCIVGIEFIKSLIEMDLLNNSNKNIYYNNIEISDIIKKLQPELDNLCVVNEMLVKHRATIKDNREMICKIFDNIINSIYDIEIKLTKSNNNIISLFKGIDCTSKLIEEYDEDIYINSIEEIKLKEIVRKFLYVIKDKYKISRIGNDLLLNDGLYILKKYKTKMELRQKIVNDELLINIKYEKPREKEIIMELKNDVELWNYLEKKLNI